MIAFCKVIDVDMFVCIKSYHEKCFLLQDEQIRRGATPPMYLQCDLSAMDLTSLGSKFDVILIDPPMEEYQRRASGIAFSWQPWDFEEVTEVFVYLHVLNLATIATLGS